MPDSSHEQIDALFQEIRLTILEVRNNDPENGNTLKGLIRQLELWVDSLVIDSIKQKSQAVALQKRREKAETTRDNMNAKSKFGSELS